MRFPSKEVIDSIRQAYPVGCRVELVQMDDVQAPPIGMKGTVLTVDDIGTIHVRWDSGSRIGVAYGEDVCRRIEG